MAMAISATPLRVSTMPMRPGRVFLLPISSVKNVPAFVWLGCPVGRPQIVKSRRFHDGNPAAMASRASEKYCRRSRMTKMKTEDAMKT
ncbi:hypothetical protein D3C87_1586200 [compost metagenome]